MKKLAVTVPEGSKMKKFVYIEVAKSPWRGKDAARDIARWVRRYLKDTGTRGLVWTGSAVNR